MQPKLMLALEAHLIYCWLLLSDGQLKAQDLDLSWAEGKRTKRDPASNTCHAMWQVGREGCACLNKGEGKLPLVVAEQ